MDDDAAAPIDLEGLSVSDRAHVDKIYAVKQWTAWLENDVSFPPIFSGDMVISKMRLMTPPVTA